MSIDRTQMISERLDKFGVDALVLNPGPSLVYFTGLQFHLMERPVVAILSKSTPIMILPELEMQKISKLTYKIHSFPYGEDPVEWVNAFKAAASEVFVSKKKIGIEPHCLRLLEYGFVKSLFQGCEFINAEELISSFRICKDDTEISLMKKAVQIAQDALRQTLPFIREGVSEKEIAAELTVQLLRCGSDPELAFSPIVSGGLNSANPHATPGDRKIISGDLLVIDWGATCHGYISDLTRTFAIGTVDAEYQKIHKIVQDANQAGRDAAKPGEPCWKMDQAAREVIVKAGYGEFFTHRTGHGIGMEGHEEPYIRQGNDQILQPGMAFTIEPGIYLPGRNGVRIEDDMVVTPNGCESMSNFPRQLITIS